MIVDSKRHRRCGAEDHGRMMQMTDQTGTMVKKRRALIAVGVLLLAHRLGKGDDDEKATL